MADLFREVDEVMRQERIEKFWSENKAYIIGVILGTILLTGLISGYRSWNSSVKEKQTAALIAMQESPEYPGNILNAEELPMRAGLRGIALLQAAGTFLDQDKTEDALTLYQRVSQDKELPGELQDLGTLMSVRLQIDRGDQDGQSLLDQLIPLVSNLQSPWVHHARIEAALITADKLGDYSTALTHLNAVLDTPDLPQSLTDRARALAHLYGMKNKSISEKQDETG
ncbi:MAG: hypothetical protein H6860_02245 [Rhodospirillales bacterium]|nr:hypothetical protein [Rhodospirillales bacterium]